MSQLLDSKNGYSDLADRKMMAGKAFNVSASYDSAIQSYFTKGASNEFRAIEGPAKSLRYGENPHQQGTFYGDLDQVFDQLHGKEISYNNLIDIDAALHLIHDFRDQPTFAILKHNNACGLASRAKLLDAWKDALAGDPISAFGGILICNQKIDIETAEEINKLFFEVILAPGYDDESLTILKAKKNRIILSLKTFEPKTLQYRSLLNGAITQEKDLTTEDHGNLQEVTKIPPSEKQIRDLLFANKIAKHTKSNTIVLAKNEQLLASGVGQTSRVDALKQAIQKAKHFEFDLDQAVMASDAFFPFPDCVEIAHKAGITAVIHPGGSVRDKDSIDFCDENGMAMVTTGHRHFKH